MHLPTVERSSAPFATPAYCACDTLVLGCGNELFGDDGFGPAVARRLRQAPGLPRGILAMDVGTGVRQVLFDVVLSAVRPRKILVVDAVDVGRAPGDVWTMAAGDLPPVKCDDFSMHQLPTSNLLRELSELGGVDVTCVVGQVSRLPPEVRPGLSAPVQRAVERAANLILGECRAGAKDPPRTAERPVRRTLLEEREHG
jgi:coenzyme F420 hydrogenase subunit delta